MTHAALAFAQGRIIESFCTQPAAAFFCMLAVVAAFFALLIAVFGVYSAFLERRVVSLKLRYIVAAILFILAAGWAVTLARALV
jgi:signal transduction histidine kinase